MECHVSANQPSEPSATDVPIWAPYYGASFPIAVARFWKKYATFSGRASRSEFWWAVLGLAITGGIVDILVSIVLASLNIAATATTSKAPVIAPWHLIILLLVVIWGLAFLIPSYAITSRRLHDSNRSAWLILVILIPFVGGIVLLVMTIADPNPLGSRFDRQPAPN